MAKILLNLKDKTKDDLDKLKAINQTSLVGLINEILSKYVEQEDVQKQIKRYDEFFK